MKFITNIESPERTILARYFLFLNYPKIKKNLQSYNNINVVKNINKGHSYYKTEAKKQKEMNIKKLSLA